MPEDATRFSTGFDDKGLRRLWFYLAAVPSRALVQVREQWLRIAYYQEPLRLSVPRLSGSRQ
jgi:hypothetical protein